MSSMTYRDFDIETIRAEFPILQRQINGKPLVYLDNAASAQKPEAVISAMADQARTAYANVHRGLHTLANETTDRYEQARKSVQTFLNAPSEKNIVFTKGATEGINIVAAGLAETIQPGDEIILSVMEHHSNIIPWHFLRERCGAVLKWIELTEEGGLDMAALEAAIGPKTRLIALSHMSNVLGTVNDVKKITALARAAGVLTLIDGCQAVVHLDLDMIDLDCDFYVFSGHKLYGPTGIGVLYGQTEALEALRPFQGGGEMIETVSREAVTYNELPYRLEAGTPPILEAIGLGAAIDWFSTFKLKDIQAHEDALYAHAREGVSAINGLKIYGETADKGPVMSFSLIGAHPHDISQIADKYGVALRAGHHCAQPLMSYMEVSATARASFGIYNTHKEVDNFIEALEKACKMLV